MKKLRSLTMFLFTLGVCVSAILAPLILSKLNDMHEVNIVIMENQIKLNQNMVTLNKDMNTLIQRDGFGG